MAKKSFLRITLIGLSILFFSGCGFNTNQKENKNANTTQKVISDELHQAHCDLLTKANQEMAVINQKVRDLNDKIREKEEKLTDVQNAALDDFELKQKSINQRMHQIKDVNQEEWESFKTTFEKDLDEIKTAIDNILNDL